jgi:two-component system, OmpR family, response regulator MtrA
MSPDFTMTSPKILLIDDDRAVASALTKALESECFTVCYAADAGTAMFFFDSVVPDLVLLDLGLPDASGWEVFEHMTRTSPLVPVVIVTARPAQLKLARLAGAAALVEKPADVSLLVKTMRHLLDEPEHVRLKRLVIGRPATRWLQPARSSAPNELPANQVQPLEP